MSRHRHRIRRLCRHDRSRKTSEYRLDKCTLSYSVLSEDAYTLSCSESDISDIEKRILASDEDVFYFYEICWGLLLRSLEDEFDLILGERFIHEFYFLELPLTTLSKSGPRSSSEPIDELAFTLDHRLLLFVVFLSDRFLVDFLVYGL